MRSASVRESAHGSLRPRDASLALEYSPPEAAGRYVHQIHQNAPLLKIIKSGKRLQLLARQRFSPNFRAASVQSPRSSPEPRQRGYAAVTKCDFAVGGGTG